MINRISNFKPAYNAGERMTLPPAIYEGHIINAKVDDNGTTQTLLIQVEIDKGEYAGFYRKQYESQTGQQYSVKYKGVYRVQLPDGQDAEHDNWRQHQLEGLVWALEDGNPGYKWDWDETKLKGLKVGLNVREREYYVNKKFGVTTEIGRIESIAKVNDPDQSKRPKPMKKRELNQRDKKQRELDEAGDQYIEVTGEELPWS